MNDKYISKRKSKKGPVGADASITRKKEKMARVKQQGKWITVKKTYLEKKIKANPHKDTIKIKA